MKSERNRHWRRCRGDLCAIHLAPVFSGNGAGENADLAAAATISFATGNTFDTGPTCW